MLLTLSSAGTTAQTLGDAAAKARAVNREPAAVALTDRDLPDSRPWQITAPGLAFYASIRADLTELRRSRPDVNTRLFDASRTVARLADLERALIAEPLVIAILESYKVSAREYLRMDQAMLTASAWAWRDTPALRRQQIHLANVRFLREHPQLVRKETSRYRGHQWYDEQRFIEQF